MRYPGSHSSGPAVACQLERPTREQREPRYRPPIWSCSGWGLPCRFCYQKRGGLLPDSLATADAPCGAHTVSPSPDPTSFSLQERDFAALRPQSRTSAIGRLFSVALSIASRRPAVNRHPALRSPDFPLRKRIVQRLPGQLRNGLSHRKAGVPGLWFRHDSDRTKPRQESAYAATALDSPSRRLMRDVVLCANELCSDSRYAKLVLYCAQE